MSGGSEGRVGPITAGDLEDLDALAAKVYAIRTAPAPPPPPAATKRPSLKPATRNQPAPRPPRQHRPAWVSDDAVLATLAAEGQDWLSTLHGRWARFFDRRFPVPTEARDAFMRTAGWHQEVPADFSMEPEAVADVVRRDGSWLVWCYAEPYVLHYWRTGDLERIRRLTAALAAVPEGQPGELDGAAEAGLFGAFLRRTRSLQMYYLGRPISQIPIKELPAWNRDAAPPANVLPVLPAREYHTAAKWLTLPMPGWPKAAAMCITSALLDVKESTLKDHLREHRKGLATNS